MVQFICQVISENVYFPESFGSGEELKNIFYEKICPFYPICGLKILHSESKEQRYFKVHLTKVMVV